METCFKGSGLLVMWLWGVELKAGFGGFLGIFSQASYSKPEDAKPETPEANYFLRKALSSHARLTHSNSGRAGGLT